MADLSDVQNALVAMAAQVLYPNGTSQPSIIMGDIKIYAGWPNPQQLDADLAANVCHVSIYARPEEKNTTRYPRDFQELSRGGKTVSLSVVNNTLVVGGTVTVPQNVTAQVNGNAYSYTVQTTDTLTSIATALTALINANTTCTNTGPIITIPTAYRLVARNGAIGLMIRELRRQERTFQIVAWTPTPTLRDRIASVLDVAYATNAFITLADGTAARIIYKSSPVTDGLQNANMYRRDLFYSVEYATTDTTSAAEVTDFIANISNDAGVTHTTINI